MADMPHPVKRPGYDNTGRAAQSQQTRQRILDAARQLIVSRGYRAATIAAIAAAAGVHVDTVYELAGRKPVILRELIEQAVSGTDHPVAAEDRGYVTAMVAEPDPAAKLAIYAQAITGIHARLAPLLLALRDASATEPEAAAAWRDISDRRAANMRKLAASLAQAGGLRAGLSIDEAADTIWATNSPDLYILLTTERGWSPGRYQHWLNDTWHRLLLPP